MAGRGSRQHVAGCESKEDAVHERPSVARAQQACEGLLPQCCSRLGPLQLLRLSMFASLHQGGQSATLQVRAAANTHCLHGMGECGLFCSTQNHGKSGTTCHSSLSRILHSERASIRRLRSALGGALFPGALQDYDTRRYVLQPVQVERFCRERGVELVVVGPEAPLVAGLADSLTAAGIECGASAAAFPWTLEYLPVTCSTLRSGG